MLYREGFSFAGPFSQVWTFFIRAASAFGDAAARNLRLDVKPTEVLSELQRAYQEAWDAYASKGYRGSDGPEGFVVAIESGEAGLLLRVSFGACDSQAYLEVEPEGEHCFMAVGAFTEEGLDAAADSIRHRWDCTRLAMPDKQEEADNTVTYHSPRGTVTVGPFTFSGLSDLWTCPCPGGVLIARGGADGLRGLGGVAHSGECWQGTWPNEEPMEAQSTIALWTEAATAP